MPTPRFKDLTPEDAVEVLDAFLGGKSRATFTEKLAGQNFTAVVMPDGEVKTTTKSAAAADIKLFPSVTDALKKYHPRPEEPVRYSFEVVNASRRPDFIAYDLTAPTVAVEFSGALTLDAARVLNSAQDEVKFYTHEDIKKTGFGPGTPEQQKILKAARDRLASGEALTTTEKATAEDVLMDLLDSGKIPSAIGGTRIEGLFGRIGDVGFKIPSKKYAGVQRMQAGLYGAVKRLSKKNFVEKMMGGGSSRLGQDVRGYLESLTKSPPEAGFRYFFTPVEAEELLRLPLTDMSKMFYDRVQSRNWPGVSSERPTEKLENMRRGNNRLLLREYIRRLLVSL